MTSQKNSFRKLQSIFICLLFFGINGCMNIELTSKIDASRQVKPESALLIIEPILGYPNFFGDIQDGIESALEESGVTTRTIFYGTSSFENEEKRVADMVRLYKPNVTIEISVANDNVKYDIVGFDHTNGRTTLEQTAELKLNIQMKSTVTNTVFWSSDITTKGSPILESNSRLIRGKKTAKAILKRMKEDGIFKLQ